MNRLFIPYLTEAFWLLEEGASPAEIDRAMVDFGFAMGPLQLIDMSGLDILVKTHAIMQRAFPHHGEPRRRSPGGWSRRGTSGRRPGPACTAMNPGDRTPSAPRNRAGHCRSGSATGRRPRRRLDHEQIVPALMLRWWPRLLAWLEERVCPAARGHRRGHGPWDRTGRLSRRRVEICLRPGTGPRSGRTCGGSPAVRPAVLALPPDGGSQRPTQRSITPIKNRSGFPA